MRLEGTIVFIHPVQDSNAYISLCTRMVSFDRARTKKIYTMTSRKSKKELYDICKELKVQYIVYEGGWCLRGNAG